MSISHPIFALFLLPRSKYQEHNRAFQEGTVRCRLGLPSDKVDQSIIGTIGRIDAPQPPHSQG